ncbi:MAG: BamA/TamA family outer membrane protein [Deltaproteobacteria bacterium]|nr:BamA/TamA family outer membrane protein [Deltaproteobacteria bacterium]
MSARVLVFVLSALLFVWAPSARAESDPPTTGDELTGFDAADTTLVAPSDDDIGELVGRPIVGVSVETAGRRWRERPSLRSVEAGTLLTVDVARRAMQELLETGRFAQAYVDARPHPQGVVLRVVGVPRRIVAQVTTDAPGVATQRLQTALGLQVGSELTEPILREARARVLELYRRVGFRRAQVTLSPVDTDAPDRVVLRLRVVSGPPERIARRIFVIAPRLRDELGALRERYRSGEGDIASEETLREADSELAELLRQAGFLQASVAHRLVRTADDTFLYVDLDTGPRYRFAFTGANAFDSSELRAALDLERAVEPSPVALSDRLASYYRKRGYLDARVDVEDRPISNDAVRHVEFRIHEGIAARVVKRELVCLPADAPPGLTERALQIELDASLEADLPGRSFFTAIDEAVADAGLGQPGGSRAPTRRPEPTHVFEPEVYQRALEHLSQLLQSKGYLNAIVGPVTVLRARCAVGRGGACESEALPVLPAPRCAKDALDLPVAEPASPDGLACTPDLQRGISCSPEITLRIPIHLGPETRLYDVVFDGNRHFTSPTLLERSQLVLGEPLSQLEIDAARTRLQGAYADDGYHYASIRVDLDMSPDKTRARARVTIVEREPVAITGYEVQGASRTDHALILGRLALCRELERCSESERYYRRSKARESEEQIAGLGVFSSVSLSLEDPDVPQRQKRVIISVVEQPTQYLEPRLGFSTGEGFRFAFEYGHRNVAGKAIGLIVRLEFGYLPDFLILDSGVRENFATYLGEVSQRLERRNAVSLRFPDIGLGPQVALNVDGVDVRDNQRDFTLSREALLPLLNYRPLRNLTLQLGSSVEANEIRVYRAGGIADIVAKNPGLATLLRVPEGRTLAFSQRVGLTWDRRDNPFAATRGTLLVAGVEHVTALPLEEATQIDSEFLRLTARFAGYLRLTRRGLALALSLAGGHNVQLKSTSATYPDRLFFIGGVNTVRGFALDSLVPEDLATEVLAGRLSLDSIGVRAGNLFVNPRAELRVPLTETFALGLFLDAGNVWSKAESIKSAADLLELRYATGAGLRATTPVGPIAFDGGLNLSPRPWESTGAIHFSIGLF